MGDESSLVGKTLDHYEILEPLGRGGMADVYLADDTRHRRRVAVKVLRPEATASLGVERFLGEIEITANLQHPHILQLYDSGELDGTPYYVMPHVEGESLRQRLRRGAMPVDEALEIARQVGAALQYAHEHGVVHRDLKPENIMLQAGQALVADFGIALALSDGERTRLTAVGVSIGTPAYMSPEQAAGEYDIDARTDVYALGVVLYEMLTGEPPFVGKTAHTVLTKVLTEMPSPVHARRPEVPPRVSRAITAALAKEASERPASAGELVAELEVESAAPGAERMSTRAKVAIGVLVTAAVAVGAFAAMHWRGEVQDREWVRLEAIPRIQQLLNEAETVQAFQLATRAQQLLPDDPTIGRLLNAASYEISIDSDPVGALVSYRPYEAGEWVTLGATPLQAVRLPASELVVRFERAGSLTHSRGFLPIEGIPLIVSLTDADPGDDVVAVPSGSFALGGEPVDVAAFHIDRAEVTNAEFQRFIDDGGYGDSAAWLGRFAALGVTIDGERAVAELRDATGRPGPAGWELSRFPANRDDYPVQGVSWFEAVAFCEWQGKSLPTFYHWKQAAGLDVRDNMLAASNIATTSAAAGPVPVGSSESFGVNGTVDMAGNVREWVWNESRQGRYVLGGAWDGPSYLYTNFEAVDPWNRAEHNGFRCAEYDDMPAPDVLAPISEPYFDFHQLEPADDETFAAYARFYDYDPIDLDPRSTVVETTGDWTRERVEITAAYPEERVPLHVFLPTNAEPPYQAVVYFPGVTAFYLSSSENIPEQSQLMFLLLSGRAVIYPVLKHTYERGRSHDDPMTPTLRRQQTVWMVQDIMRTVDYIVERPDLDESKIAYMGVSFGAELAVPVALEKRFSALVLVGAALDAAWIGSQPEEAAPWNFVYRITTPTILINGDADVMHPYAEGQVPFFEAIDVPENDKRFVSRSGGHLPPWNEVIRYTLDWLDERLGPVSTEGR